MEADGMRRRAKEEARPVLPDSSRLSPTREPQMCLFLQAPTCIFFQARTEGGRRTWTCVHWPLRPRLLQPTTSTIPTTTSAVPGLPHHRCLPLRRSHRAFPGREMEDFEDPAAERWRSVGSLPLFGCVCLTASERVTPACRPASQVLVCLDVWLIPFVLAIVCAFFLVPQLVKSYNTSHLQDA